MTHVDTINVNTVSNPLLPDHEIRKLRWQNKQLAKQVGHQGDTIYRLRCELANVRELNGRVERGELRDYERSAERMDRIIRSLEADNAALVAAHNELYAQNRELKGELSTRATADASQA